MSFELELLRGALIRGPSGPPEGPATQRYPIALLALRDDPRYSRLLETVARSWDVEELTAR